MNQSDKSSRVKNSLLLAEKLQLSGWVDPPVRAGARQRLKHLISPAAAFKIPLLFLSVTQVFTRRGRAVKARRWNLTLPSEAAGG